MFENSWPHKQRKIRTDPGKRTLSREMSGWGSQDKIVYLRQLSLRVRKSFWLTAWHSRKSLLWVETNPGLGSHIGCVILSKILNLCFIICKIPIIILIIQVTVFKIEQSLCNYNAVENQWTLLHWSFSGWKVLSAFIHSLHYAFIHLLNNSWIDTDCWRQRIQPGDGYTSFRI